MTTTLDSVNENIKTAIDTGDVHRLADALQTFYGTRLMGTRPQTLATDIMTTARLTRGTLVATTYDTLRFQTDSGVIDRLRGHVEAEFYLFDRGGRWHAWYYPVDAVAGWSCTPDHGLTSLDVGAWQRDALTCEVCGRTFDSDDELELVAFADKACHDCAPALRERLEFPGWCD